MDATIAAGTLLTILTTIATAGVALLFLGRWVGSLVSELSSLRASFLKHVVTMEKILADHDRRIRDIETAGGG